MPKAGYSRYSKEDIENMARTVVRIIKQHLADHDPNKFKSWLLAAESLGARSRSYKTKKEEEIGYYWAPTQTIYYYHDTTLHERIRVFAHELAHHIQCVFPFLVTSGTHLERFDDTRKGVQHLVARRAEIMLLGEPLTKEEEDKLIAEEKAKEEEEARAEAMEEKEWREKNGWPVIGRAGYKFF